MEKAYGNCDLKMMEDFCQADGPSGAEKEAVRVMKSYLEGYVDEFDYDALGSIIGVKKGRDNGPKLMLAGHIDEIGFLVTKIEDNGFLRIAPLGGWWGHVLLSKPLIITTDEGKKIYGVIGAKAPHGMKPEERDKVQAVKDMYIDIGVKDREEALSLGIKEGNFVTPKSDFVVMSNPNYLCAKAWDDRVGALIATEVVRNLKGVEHECDVYAVGTVQEEVGLRGAKTTAYKIEPDVAIALDVTTADDCPGGDNNCKMGVGVTIGIADFSVLGHRGLISLINKICDELKLDVQRNALLAGGTDSGEIHKTKDGVVTVTLSIPSRYIHSHYSLIHRKDYCDTVTLVTELAKRLNHKMLQELKESNH